MVLFEKLRYMHRNPVKRGLAASPELWRWSSFRAYFLGEAGRVPVNEWEVLKMKMRPLAGGWPTLLYAVFFFSHIRTWVPLDKREGSVKTKVSCAVPRHRLFCQRG